MMTAGAPAPAKARLERAVRGAAASGRGVGRPEAGPGGRQAATDANSDISYPPSLTYGRSPQLGAHRPLAPAPQGEGVLYSRRPKRVPEGSQ